ncbi:putative Golgi apparatus membrane protein-like protein CG5021 isoform X2 [Calliopsis andreniformis]|uniref:putative Golgi apparatus membrane protein-like protein CG5021 isoform X2 n=1 Tax=Calliopsis andreniformis TaxID=337506 RepID=UPI003FCD88C1
MASASVPLLMDDDTIAFGEEDEAGQNNNKLKHPYVTMFHLAFRIAAIVVYMMCGWFSNSFIASFVTVVLLLSMDFWTVKNITGRLMVGLRWWNYVDDNGNSHWVFESRKNRINVTEARIFWLALILCPLLWSVFFVGALFSLKFKWLLLVCIAIVLNGANLYGYVKCKMGNDRNISAATSEFLRKQVIQNVASMMTRSPPTNNPNNPPTNMI